MEDQFLERMGLLVEIAERKGKLNSRLGKTSTMKILYLLQEAYRINLGYSFSLFTYGPYDSSVMSDLDYASTIGILDVEYEGESGYKITVGEKANLVDTYRESVQQNYANQFDDLFMKFGRCSAKGLELRSTLVLIAKENLDLSNEDLMRIFKNVKPRFADEEIQEAIDDLQRSGIFERIKAQNLVAK